MDRHVPVSVIIPCYCCADVLSRALDSVLNQSELPDEVILVDDASPDQGKTKRCIEEMISSRSGDGGPELRACYLEVNVGPGGARNAGWDIATQPYIAFLDADDSWAPEKLSIQYHWMRAHPEYTLSCHESVHISNMTKRSRDETIRYGEMYGYWLMLKNSIPTRSVMLVNQTGFRFPPAMRYAEDYWLWLNMVMRGERLAKLIMPLVFSYKREYGEGGLSGNLRAMHEGVLFCFESLRREHLIGRPAFWAAHILEKIKYLKRIVFTKIMAD